MTGHERLLQLNQETKGVGEEMRLERARFSRLKNAEAPRIVTAFNLFQTPEQIADKMVQLLPELPDTATILEPSAGLGRLYQAARRKGFNGKMVLVEHAPQCMAELYDLTNGDNVQLIQQDFLNVDIPLVDAIIMNPPFKQGLDIKHVKHALTLIKPGGPLVGLCYAGKRQETQLQPLVAHWETLPANSFKESGTSVNINLFIIVE